MLHNSWGNQGKSWVSRRGGGAGGGGGLRGARGGAVMKKYPIQVEDWMNTPGL